ncbi:MAG: BatD family protein [Puniceicoccales bacterium]|jgi:hypothetical protein|nr:BatD family protein [Puniceicoccales bacterium]
MKKNCLLNGYLLIYIQETLKSFGNMKTRFLITLFILLFAGAKHTTARSSYRSVDDVFDLFDSALGNSFFPEESEDESTMSPGGSGGNATNVSIAAHFEPDQIGIGKEVRYFVEFINLAPLNFSLPKIDGLHKLSEQVYQSSSNINGTLTQKTSYIFTFIPERAGIIEVSAYEIVIAGERYTIPPSVLTVSQDPNTHNNNRPQSQSQPVQVSVDIASQKAYVGQVIPVTISVSPNETTQLASNIRAELIGGDFLQSELSKQPESKVHGNREIYTWRTFITPVKSGQTSLVFNVSCVLQVLRKMGFFSFAEQVQRNFTSDPIAVEILPLPQAPENFTGGIGQFSLTNPHLSSDQVLVGEPITLAVDIVGQGNFSRIQRLLFAANEDWQCFAPKCTFKAQDEGEFRGTKTIEYVIIPQKTGQIALPEISLVYFSPETGTYETATADMAKKSVLVSRSSDAYSRNTSAVTDAAEADHTVNLDHSLHLLSKDTKHYKSLKPLYYNTYFWWIHGTLLFLATVLFLKTLKPSDIVRRKDKKWNIRREKQRLLKTVESSNFAEFYRLSLGILKEKLGITSDDHEHRMAAFKRLKEQGYSQISWLEEFFNEADAANFGKKKVEKLHILQQVEKISQFMENVKNKK